jgi:hypothetical protein
MVEIYKEDETFTGSIRRDLRDMKRRSLAAADIIVAGMALAALITMSLMSL